MEWLETVTGEICLLTGKLISLPLTKGVGQNLEALKQWAFKMDQEVAIGGLGMKEFIYLFIIIILFFLFASKGPQIICSHDS